MKMKRVILGILVAVIMLVAITPMANAATFSVDAKDAKYEVGDKVVVTVSVNPTRNIDITLNYDKEVFSVDKVEAIAANAETGAFKPTVNKSVAGVIEVSGADADEDLKIAGMKFTFVANKEADSVVFTASGLVTEVAETLDVTTKTVTVVKKAEKPIPDDDKKPDTKPDDNKPNTNPDDNKPDVKPDDNKPAEDTENKNDVQTPNTETKQEPATTTPTQSGNANKTQKPAKLPQTGVPYVVIALVVVAIVAGAVLVSTTKKTK